jgi:glutamate 5-kinase
MVIQQNKHNKQEIYVIKVGSSCLFDESGKINYSLLEKKAKEIESLPSKAFVVVSGAIALGKKRRHETRTNSELANVELESFASIGQPLLMDIYKKLFSSPVAQLILTNNDLVHENHIRDLIHHNLNDGILTLVNYNDCIDFKQLRKDNDTLAAQMLSYCDADKLIIFGTYDGFFDKKGRLIEEINRVDDNLYSLCNGKSKLGTGGFSTKLDAAKIVLKKDKEMIIGNIKYSVEDLINGDAKRTIFRNEYKPAA